MVYNRPFEKTLFLFSMSLLMNPIAVMLVARGQGLMAVISPSTHAESQGMLLFSSMPVRNPFIKV